MYFSLMDQCLHIKVEGKVYKTGYRYFIKQKASQLDIHGRVFYHPDHSVGIIASGQKRNLEEFIKICLSGNKDSFIQRIDSKISHPTDFSSFEVVEAYETPTKDFQQQNYL